MSLRSRQIAYIFFGCVLTALSYLAPAPQMQRANQLAIRPPAIGDGWVHEGAQSLSDRELAMLDASQHARWVFRRSATGETVLVTIVEGPAGPLSAHHPSACFGSDSFQSVPAYSRRFTTQGDGAHELRIATFEPADMRQPMVSCVYTWFDGSHWLAPSSPRIELAGNHRLVRLQITMRHAAGTNSHVHRTLCRFAESLLDQQSTFIGAVGVNPG